jgi:hypothetical protein
MGLDAMKATTWSSIVAQPRSSIALMAILAAISCSAGEPDKLQELSRFLQEYHRAPAPELAPKMLALLLDGKLIEDPAYSQDRPEQSLKLTGHAFGLIGRKEPKLVRLYETRFPKASKAGRALLLEAFWACGDQQTVKLLEEWEKDPAQSDLKEEIEATRKFLAQPVRPLPRDLPARSPTDLDLLWTDFLISGEYAPVSRILDVFDQPDLVRAKIDAFLKKHPEQRTDLFGVLESLGMAQSGPPAKLADGDLDLRFVDVLQSTEKPPPPGAARKFNQMLGLKRGDYMTVIAVKGAARWAAQSNLRRHPRLREVLKEHEKERPPGSQALVHCWLKK